MDYPEPLSPYLLTFNELASLLTLSSTDLSGILGEKFLIKGKFRKVYVSPEGVKKILSETGHNQYPFQVISMINLRGGIGKTTTAITLATRAAQYGFKTCILDLDPQGSASLAFNIELGDQDPVFYDLWKKPKEMLAESLDVIQENLKILPSSLVNSLLDSAMTSPVAQKNAVAEVCKELKSIGFDLVIIDCPPSLGAATISTICASDRVVIPVSNDSFSFKGLQLSLGEMESITQAFGLELPQINILFTRYDRRLKLSADALHRLKINYGKYLVPVLIRTSSDFPKALEKRETIFAQSRKSNARTDYDLFARYVLQLPFPEELTINSL